MERASNFRMEPFENGWAKRQGHGNTYGISYLHLYEDDLKTMFQAGVINNSNKMSAGKMRENLLDMYPDRFSIPGETEIKQFIGKLSQQYKKKGGNDASSTAKSTRGRKAGNITVSWYGTLREIVNREPNEKPEEIFRILMATFDDNLPDDLPMDNDTPDKKNIKSTISRFKTELKKSAKRSILV